MQERTKRMKELLQNAGPGSLDRCNMASPKDMDEQQKNVERAGSCAAEKEEAW